MRRYTRLVPVIASCHDVDSLIRALAAKVRDGATDPQALAFIGIRRRGDVLAARVAKVLGVTDVGAIDITLYRDDLSETGASATVGKTAIPFSVEGREIVVFDDVIMTGRSVLAALREILDFGRPASIKLAVLVERPERELPIQPSYSALKVAPGPREKIDVRLLGQDAEDSVSINVRA
jgi:pyrimidine operon attenuation protein / uracil phosphoribosyltransferase